MSDLHLYYFNIRGLGEYIRLLLVDNKVNYDNKMVTFEEWPKHKPQMQFGQMPCLKEGDFQLVQTGAILRYLAKKIGNGLYGSNDKEAAVIDMTYDGVVDFRQKYSQLIYREWSPENKEKFIKETLPAELEKFEKLLKSAPGGGNHYFNGEKISYADYAMYEVLDAMVTLSADSLEKFPLLKAFHARVGGRPNLKPYLESAERKALKINGNGNQ
jgi:glutathione S-transferase